MPILAGVEFVAEDVGRFVGFGLERLVVGVNSVVGITVDDSDEGAAAWVVCWEHHVEVYFTVLALDI